jgi:hypothetical protein
MALAPVGGGGGPTGGPTGGGYIPIASVRTFRVLGDNSTQPIQAVTAQSVQYGVQFSFFIDGKTWDTDGGPPFISNMTGYVDDVCGMDHVIGFRTEQDLGPDQLLYNYAVITVGTEDGLITDEARVRMDGLFTGAEVPAIAAAWARLQAIGAV